MLFKIQAITESRLISFIKKRIAGLDIISIGSITKKYHTIDKITFVCSGIVILNNLENINTELIEMKIPQSKDLLD